jgi:hypothetical protein
MQGSVEGVRRRRQRRQEKDDENYTEEEKRLMRLKPGFWDCPCAYPSSSFEGFVRSKNWWLQRVEMESRRNELLEIACAAVGRAELCS